MPRFFKRDKKIITNTKEASDEIVEIALLFSMVCFMAHLIYNVLKPFGYAL